MKARRISDVVERVVAWHNRHPLARRITKSQVQGVGVVALPFALQRRPGERTGGRTGDGAAESGSARRDPVLSAADAAEPIDPTAPTDPSGRPDLPDLSATGAPVDLPVLSDVAPAGATAGAGIASPATAPASGWRRPWQALWALPGLRALRQRWPRLAGVPPTSGPDRRPLTPIFGDEWTFRMPLTGLGRWVRRHGVYPLEGYGHWPMRQVDADIPLARRADARGLEGRTVRHLLTAVIDVDGRRVRLLIAPSDDLARAPVHGRRVWSPPRAAGMAAGALALGLVGAVGLRAIGGLPGLHGHETGLLAAAVPGAVGASGAASRAQPAAAAPASAAEAASGASGRIVVAEAGHGQPAAAPAPQGTDPHHASTSASASAAPSAPSPATHHPTPGHGHAGSATTSSTTQPRLAAQTPETPASSQPSSPTPPAGPPTHVGPTVQARSDGAAPLARIRPHLTEDERRQARLQAEALRPAATGTAAAAGGASAPATLLGQGPVYALVTPLARSRDDALAQQVLLQGLKAQTPTLVPTQLDVMPSQGRWRVVWWPHPRQQEAEALLKEARARGLKVELIVF